jgi:O-antigen ligase/Flp pilus assembly protein TadD
MAITGLSVGDRPRSHQGIGNGPGTLGHVLSAIGALIVATLIGVSILHWGGVYPHIGSLLHLGGACLWLVLGAIVALQIRLHRPGPDVIDAAVALFILYAAWRYARTPVEYTARLEWCWILTYGAVFAFVRHGLPNRHWALGLISLIIVFALLSCIYAFIHRTDPTHLIWGLPRPNYGVRISGTFGCPNHFANLMVMATLAGLFLGSYSRFPWPLRLFLFYLAAVLTAGLYLSVSRGGYIAWLAGMIVVAVCLCRTEGIRWWWKAAISVLVAAGTTLVILKNPFVMDRLDRMMEGDVRLKLAQISLKLWEAAPIWGHGIGSYDYVYLRNHGPDLQSRALYAHCDYLNTLVDYGAVGLGLILVFLIAVSVFLWRNSRNDPHERERVLLRLGWAALLAMAVHSVFDFSLHIPACALAFFTILGASVMRTPREERPGSGGIPSLATWGTLVLAALAAAWTLGSLGAQTQQGQRLMRLKETDFQKMTAEEIDRQGDRLHAADPGAYPLLTRVGDALRVKTANIAAEIAEAPPEAIPDLIRAREQTGALALKFYQRAHRVAPLEDTLLVKQGMVLDVMKRHIEAYLAYAQAIEYQPDNRYFRFTYGLHLIETGQKAAALEQLELAAYLPVDPKEDTTLRDTSRAALEYLRSQLK